MNICMHTNVYAYKYKFIYADEYMNISMSRFTPARAGTGDPQSLSVPQVDLTRLMLWRSMRKHIYR